MRSLNRFSAAPALLFIFGICFSSLEARAAVIEIEHDLLKMRVTSTWPESETPAYDEESYVGPIFGDLSGQSRRISASASIPEYGGEGEANSASTLVFSSFQGVSVEFYLDRDCAVACQITSGYATAQYDLGLIFNVSGHGASLYLSPDWNTGTPGYTDFTLMDLTDGMLDTYFINEGSGNFTLDNGHRYFLGLSGYIKSRSDVRELYTDVNLRGGTFEVSEPSTIALLGFGLLGVLISRRMRSLNPASSK